MFGNVLALQTAHGNFLMLCQMVLFPNINFLISKQYKTPKIDPKMLQQQAGIATFRYTLSFTQTSRALELNENTVDRYINTSTSINCIFSLACFCFDTNMLNKLLCLVCTWFQYLLYKFKRHSKLHLNFHPIKNLLTFASGYLEKLCNFCPHLSLETVFPALKLIQIYCININISFLKKLAIFKSQIGSSSSTQIPSLKEYPHNLTKYESKRNSIIPVLQFYGELTELWKYSLS